MARFAWAGLMVAVAIAPMVQAQPMDTGGNRPVMLRGEDGLDPCALGMIADHEQSSDQSGPEGGGAILVFPGDSTELEYVDTLVHGDPVWVCDASENMVGIVYAQDRDQDCEVTTPVADDRPYLGPCNWGWVVTDWVEITAG
jgi:hypothetical protein